MKRGQLYDLWAHFSVGSSRLAERISASAAVPLITSYNNPEVVSFELRIHNV